jgi:hypothetical protein
MNCGLTIRPKYDRLECANGRALRSQSLTTGWCRSRDIYSVATATFLQRVLAKIELLVDIFILILCPVVAEENAVQFPFCRLNSH